MAFVPYAHTNTRSPRLYCVLITLSLSRAPCETSLSADIAHDPLVRRPGDDGPENTRVRNSTANRTRYGTRCTGWSGKKKKNKNLSVSTSSPRLVSAFFRRFFFSIYSICGSTPCGIRRTTSSTDDRSILVGKMRRIKSANVRRMTIFLCLHTLTNVFPKTRAIILVRPAKMYCFFMTILSSFIAQISV